MSPACSSPNSPSQWSPIRTTAPSSSRWSIGSHRRTAEAFLRAIYAIEPIRRRNGASNWRVYRDLEDEGRFVERYVIASWAEYVRSRSRMTVAERKLQVRVRQLHGSDVPIRISRLIAVRPQDAPGAALSISADAPTRK